MQLRWWQSGLCACQCLEYQPFAQTQKQSLPRSCEASGNAPLTLLPATGLALARSFFVFALRSASACAAPHGSVRHAFRDDTRGHKLP